MRTISRKFFRLPALAALVAVVSLSGCATRPTDPDELAAYKENNDPLEPMNRYFFEVNYALDELLIKPIASWYDTILPTPVEHSVHNFLRNLNGPVILANDLFQGNGKRAGITAKRFLINTTLGAGGLFDVAADWFGLTYHDEDFGQTLAVWGVGEGPFVELPLLGPSNARDTVGTAVDMALNPLTFVGGAPATYAGVATGSANVVDTRSQHLHDLDELERNSLDYYATLRSVYRQHRDAEISAAKQPAPEGQVDISFPNTRP